MADQDFTAGEDVLDQLMKRLDTEIEVFIKAREPEATDLPRVTRSRDLKKADFTVQWAAFAAKRKMNPVAYVSELVEGLQAHVDQAKGLITKVQGVGPYLNLFVDRARVFRLVIRAVSAQGDKFGHTNAAGNKRVIIEHTSSNPNAPLHIGNLRNVIIGAHLAKMQAACGYQVKQAFYVNDLGAQIGLTALAYSRVYAKIQPFLKIDHWIGAMYAVMNTCQELQQVGVNVGDVEDACAKGKEAVDALMQTCLEGAEGDEKKTKGITEYFDIYQDLRERFEKMMVVMLEDVRTIEDIKVEAGKLNLAYERQEDWAVKIFRKMVCDCLTGVQTTLSTYGVQHDQFDFESELGWEGSNNKVLEIMKNSDYYVPQTQCNDKGVPQGAYLDMDGFIRDQGLKVGKGGYQKDYPPLYVLRPDGSTLYTYRDIVYSFKKASQSDLILNIICSEQDLAQQKVSLGMMMMNPEMKGRQYHLSYDLVKLTTGKMSGRRGRYLLADDLYDDLKTVIREKMSKKFKEKGEDISPELFRRGDARGVHGGYEVRAALRVVPDPDQLRHRQDHRFRGRVRAVHPVQLDPRRVRRQEVQRQGGEGNGARASPAGLCGLRPPRRRKGVGDSHGVCPPLRVHDRRRRDAQAPGTPRAAIVRHAQGLRLSQRHGARLVGVLRPRGCAHLAHGQSAGGGVERRRRDARARPPVQGVQAGHRQRPQAAHDRASGAHVGELVVCSSLTQP